MYTPKNNRVLLSVLSSSLLLFVFHSFIITLIIILTVFMCFIDVVTCFTVSSIKKYYSCILPSYSQHSSPFFFVRVFSSFIIFIFYYSPLSIILFMFMLFFPSYYFLLFVWVFLFSNDNKEWKVLIYFFTILWFYFTMLCGI